MAHIYHHMIITFTFSLSKITFLSLLVYKYSLIHIILYIFFIIFDFSFIQNIQAYTVYVIWTHVYVIYHNIKLVKLIL